MKRWMNNIFTKDNMTFVFAMDHGVVIDEESSMAYPSQVG